MPTPEQWDEIQAILENDCEIAQVYIDADGKTCAIGALALVAGVDADYLRFSTATWPPSIQAESVSPLRATLERRFGLTESDMVGIQRANDFASNATPATERRSRVLAKVAELRAQS